ncbi:carboxypeptidase-like regulatory domain-containing protein [Sabulilitoribacter multivorans]|uniref:Carboxypeptidase-like regulatory domain-containing protein n=1 Tax=Flaviramulus multivorans TaxID=1304750 RepID=A0ABS9IIN0_9FLAO|nr:carboxypeptidase-like regulatory domain-containing protein [Flaviramulus multivorans]MCF7560243.1 carboxypeptidase-like regulatory domain-containing protein [Flaviramulus multivorans]
MKNIPFILLLSFCFILNINAQEVTNFKEIKGSIIDSKTNDPLIFTDLVIKGTNISTVSNSDGEFSLKVPDSLMQDFLVISRLGYEKKELEISSIENNAKIILIPSITVLNPVQIKTYTDARALLRATLKKKSTLYNDSNTLMTAFYRETIKKRRKNASLSEAVVQIHKQPYTSSRRDIIQLVKARKNTNYNRLDTLAMKLQGGPFSNLYTDIIKYPEYIFTDENIPLYDFSFDKSTQINGSMVFVVKFKQKPNITEPLYYGKLYIDAETLALTNAIYSLNVENKELSSQLYVRKKPRKVDVYPTEATYRVNYRTQNGKWHYAYSNIVLTFKVNWKGELFNSVYTLNSEMAITDWELNTTSLANNRQNILRPTSILVDQASGFSDPRFWGEYNIIEPEKSIESAIEKIQRQLKKKS